MDKEDLIDLIGNKDNIKNEVKKGVKQLKMIIFQIDDRSYGIEASSVKEIYTSDFIHPLPFVPVYIRGLINKEGDPYTVVDLNMLFKQIKLDSETFLIINEGQDHLSFMISDVLDIIKIDKSNIMEIVDNNEDSYFNSYIEYRDEKIFLINKNSILSKITSDIENE